MTWQARVLAAGLVTTIVATVLVALNACRLTPVSAATNRPALGASGTPPGPTRPTPTGRRSSTLCTNGVGWVRLDVGWAMLQPSSASNYDTGWPST